MLRALREASCARARRSKRWSSGGRLASTSRRRDARSQAAPRSCRCCGPGSLSRRHARRRARRRAARHRRRHDRRRHDARRARGDPRSPTRCARRAGSPRARRSAAMGSLAGNLLQSTRCWYWRLDWPCRLHGGDECYRARRRAPRARDLRQRLLRVGAPVRRRRGAARARRDRRARPGASFRSPSSTDVPTRGRPPDDDARARRADPLSVDCRRPTRPST